MAATDSETGEYVSFDTYIAPESDCTEYDLETGEPDCGKIIVTKHRPKFIIPKQLIQPQDDPTDKCKKCRIDPNDNFTLSKKEEVINLQEEIIFGSNCTSHRLFLIIVPTIFIYSRLSAVLTIIFEVILHVWSHKKNSNNTNESIYYRSPLHVITSQFCGVCRQEMEMERVSKLQDERQRCWRLRLEDVARRIS